MNFLQTSWSCLLTAFFLLNMDQFLYSAGLGPAPKVWFLFAFTVSFILFLPRLKAGSWLTTPVVIWAVIYFLISLMWVNAASNMDSAVEGLMLAIATVLFVLTASIVFSNADPSDHITRVLWFCLSLAVMSVALEFFFPYAFLFSKAGLGITGRAAGFYLNPNTAGQAIIVILFCMLPRIGRKAALGAIGLGTVGVALTFSRSAALALIVLIFLASVRGLVTRTVIVAIALGGIGVVLFGGLIFVFLSSYVDWVNVDSMQRVEWLLGVGNLSDFAASERQWVIQRAWIEFIDEPWIGHGLGYSWVWGDAANTHNMVLKHLVEYGILGVLIFPGFVLSAVLSRQRQSDVKWLRMVALVCLLLSLFSHNMLEQGFFVFGLLITCLLPVSIVAESSGQPRILIPQSSFTP